jgi:hypothetical protein
VPVEVADLAGDGGGDGERQKGRGDHPRDGVVGGAEVVGDAWQ